MVWVVRRQAQRGLLQHPPWFTRINIMQNLTDMSIIEQAISAQ
jgi:hypothetical protein